VNCTRCGNAMIVLELEGVEIDYCQDCGGIWLDSGELERLLGDKAEEVISRFRDERRSNEKRLRCPACRRKMKKVVCGDTHLDICKRGHGIWFDKGELAEVISQGDLNSRILDFLSDMFSDSIKEGE